MEKDKKTAGKAMSPIMPEAGNSGLYFSPERGSYEY
jgi:hypothetical protein